jgi:hypothetical protein
MSRQTFARIVLSMLGIATIIVLALFAPLVLAGLGLIIAVIAAFSGLLQLIIWAIEG